MTLLPQAFDHTAALRAIAAKWAEVPTDALDRALHEATYPVYAKALSVSPKTRPAAEVFSLEQLRAALDAGDPAAFDVALEVLGRSLPAESVVALATAIDSTSPWKRLRNLAYEMVAPLSTEASFRFLLSHPYASHLYGKSAYADGETLAYERLLASPLYELELPPPTRKALANLSADALDAAEAEREALLEPIDPDELRITEDLVTFLLSKGSERARAAGRKLVETSPEDGIRGRAASGLIDAGHREDLEFMAGYLDDADTAIRQSAIHAVLMLDPTKAWERLNGDRLMQPGAEADAEELLYELGRDLAGTGGQPVRGWAKQDPRWAELARKWLPNKKMKQPIFVLQGLGEKL